MAEVVFRQFIDASGLVAALDGAAAALAGAFPAFYVEAGADRCGRCGDTNYDEASRVCLTCTYPDDPCSRAYRG